MSPPITEGVTFHAQQAVEKAHKDSRAASQPFRQTHLLLALVEQCAAIDPAIGTLRGPATHLTPYLAAGRYPDAGPEPRPAQVEEARSLAEHAVAFVFARLPAEARP